MRIDKSVYRYVDFELKHFEDNRKKLEELKIDIIESSPEPADGQPTGKGGTSNPTEQKTVRLMSSLAILKVQDTIDSIEKVYNSLEDDYKKFFDLNYKKDRGVVATCIEVGISERTYYNMKDRIIKQVAEEMGLI